MSLPFEIAPDCAGENCTNVLASRAEFEKGRCGACWDGVDSLDLPLGESCENCNGYGHVIFDQVTEGTRKFCERNNFALRVGSDKADCLLCSGQGSKPYETLEIQ